MSEIIDTDCQIVELDISLSWKLSGVARKIHVLALLPFCE